ncbi:peptide-methionine (S)-S-oxide reductase MsrA [Echinicola sediminis]
MMLKIGFGGGCHWCTEAVFQSIKEVEQVDQGWIASAGDFDEFSEAVVVHFDPLLISQHELIEAHLLTHSCTSSHSMRKKYRSAVYFFSKEQQLAAEESIKSLQDNWEGKIITRVLPFVKFKPNKEEFLNYYLTRPEAPFCVRYIRPKLEAIKQSQADKISG